MSRKILFRGKLISDSDNHKKNQWVYGSYFKDRNNISYIYNKKENYFYIVDAETVSQYIGKNIMEILLDLFLCMKVILYLMLMNIMVFLNTTKISISILYIMVVFQKLLIM